MIKWLSLAILASMTAFLAVMLAAVSTAKAGETVVSSSATADGDSSGQPSDEPDSSAGTPEPQAREVTVNSGGGQVVIPDVDVDVDVDVQTEWYNSVWFWGGTALVLVGACFALDQLGAFDQQVTFH